jgi:hypothetical protein
VCGSDKNLYKFMVDEEDEWGEKVYKPIPPPVDDSKHYRYDELEERFMPVDAKDESTSTLGIETPFHDFPDYDFSFDSPDTSFQIGSFDFDFGGSSESAGSSGAGDGGDLGAGSGGEAGGGNGGGK